MAIGGKLNSISQAAFKVSDKVKSRLCTPITDKPTRNDLCVGIKGRPCPNVAISELPLFIVGDILIFHSDEAPNFIALNPLAGEIAESLILIFGAGLPQFNQQFDDGIFGNTGHPAICTVAFPLHWGGASSDLFFFRQFIKNDKKKTSPS